MQLKNDFKIESFRNEMKNWPIGERSPLKLTGELINSLINAGILWHHYDSQIPYAISQRISFCIDDDGG